LYTYLYVYKCRKFAYFSKKDLRKIPYSSILKTPAVWAVWIAALGNFTCVNMLFLFSPLYISKVLGFEIHHTGITAAFGPFAQFLAKVCAGQLSLLPVL
uniref:MFS_1_like domain-containing protein n=1 Tax=Gongylonema pulchrum TaxID=637853 RepID=A0A183EQX6_9BILA